MNTTTSEDKTAIRRKKEKSFERMVFEIISHALLILVFIGSMLYCLYPAVSIVSPDVYKEFSDKFEYSLQILMVFGFAATLNSVILIYQDTAMSFGALSTRLIFSYISGIYIYGVLFVFLSRTYPNQFNVANLDLISAFYLSVVCISTVGFGDIVATAPLSKIIISSEIFVGIFFNIFAFSAISSLAIDKSKRHNIQ